LPAQQRLIVNNAPTADDALPQTLAPDTLAPDTLPRHVAVIMDGNGRWATQRGLSRSDGHRAGTEAARAIVTECRTLGIGHLTMYTFSKENWGRPGAEVKFLFELLVDFLREELPNLVKRDIRLSVFGQLADLPLAARKALEHAISRTAACSAMRLNLALNYSARDEILMACRALAAEGFAPEAITEEAFAARLWTAGQPDPDLVIRTSGEVRISNFLLYQSAYSEFHFTDTLWPDFTPQHFRAALRDYAGRQRRFGKTEATPA
jgi:undecaprenyl diphosphate synthase